MKRQSELAQVPVAKIVEDMALYPRHLVDGTTVSSYMEAMQAGATFEPIRLCAKTSRIIDGFHRFRAQRRLGHTEVQAYLETVKDDADFFLRAVEANARHGRGLARFDHARILQIAKELGIERESVADVLQLRPERLESIAGTQAVTASGVLVPLKATFSHMQGRRLTKKQVEVNERSGGMRQAFYVNQLIDMLGAGLLNLDDESLMERIGVLTELLLQLKSKKAA